MTIKKRIKRLVIPVSKFRPINLLIRGSFRVLKPILPEGLTKIYSKLPVNGKVRSKLEGSNEFVMVNDGSDSIANDLYWKGIDSYEHITIHLFPRLLKHTRVFFDIGANTGIYTLIAGSQDHEIEVHAFEPVDIAYVPLTKSININKFRKVYANQIALSNFDGTSEFNLQKTVDSTIPLGSSLRKDMGDSANMRIIKVKTQKLDTYVHENNISRIDLMKVDTEGTEDKVFEGGEKTINEHRPVILCEVLSNTNIAPKLHAFFDSKKYNYYYVNDNLLEQVDKIIGDPYVVSNYLLVPEEKNPQILNGATVNKIPFKTFEPVL